MLVLGGQGALFPFPASASWTRDPKMHYPGGMEAAVGRQELVPSLGIWSLVMSAEMPLGTWGLVLQVRFNFEVA